MTSFRLPIAASCLAVLVGLGCESPEREPGSRSASPESASSASAPVLALVDEVLDLAADHYRGADWVDALTGARRSGHGRHLMDFLGRPGPHEFRFTVDLTFGDRLLERVEYPDVPFLLETELGPEGGQQTMNEAGAGSPITPEEARERLRKAMLSHPVTALVHFRRNRTRLAEPELLDLVLGRQAWRLRLMEDDQRGADLWIDPRSGQVLRCEYRVASERWGGGRFEVEFPREVDQGEAPGPPRVLTYRQGDRIQEVTLEDVEWRHRGEAVPGVSD